MAADPARSATAEIVNVIRSTLSRQNRKTTALLQTSLTKAFCGDPEAFKAIALPFTPDHIVYCRSHPLYVRAPGPTRPPDSNALITSYLRALAAYRTKHGADPFVVCLEGIGLVAVGWRR